MFLCSYSILIIQIFSNHKCACSHSVSQDFECFFIYCSGVSACFIQKKMKNFFNQLWSQKKLPAQMAARDCKTSPFLCHLMTVWDCFHPVFCSCPDFFIFFIQTGFLWGWWVLIGSSFVDNIWSMLKTIRFRPRNLILNYIMYCKAKTRLFYAFMIYRLHQIYSSLIYQLYQIDSNHI